MNQQENKKIVENLSSAVSGFVGMLEGQIKGIMNDLPKDQASKIADIIKEADLSGKTDKIKNDIQSINNMFK